MANKKFSEFVLKTSTSDVSHIVGYNGAENVQITPANFVTGGGTGVFLPLAGGTMTGDTTHNDNVKSIYGSPGNDLQIYHDSNDSYIDDAGTGDLYIKSNKVRLQSTTGENLLFAQENSGVFVYYNNAKKLETTNTGISVTGDLMSVVGFAPVLSLIGNNSGSGTIDFGDAASSNIGRIYYDHTNNYMEFKVNGAERMRIDSSGNLGLGSTDADAYGKFLVSGTGNLINANATSGAATFQLYEAGAGRFGIVTLDGTAGAKFTLAGVEKMRLDASGNLGVGTSSPTDYFSGADNLVVKQASGNGGISIVTDTSSAGALYFADGTTGDETYRGGMAYEHSSDKLFLVSGGQSKAVIDSSGNLGIGTASPDSRLDIVGDLQISSSKGGSTNRTNRIRGQHYNSSEETVTFMFLNSFDTFNDLHIGGGSSLENAVTKQLFYTASDNTTTAGSERMRLTSAGDLLVGKTAVSIATVGAEFRSGGQSLFTCDGDAPLNPNRLTSDGIIMYLRKDGTVVGTISVTGSATAYNTSSDYRLKEDLQDFKGLDLVSKIPVYDYKWKSSNDRGYGVMAHQLQEVLPQAVSGEKDAEEMQSVDYSKIVPLLVKSIQELSAKLEALECQCEKK